MLNKITTKLTSFILITLVIIFSSIQSLAAESDRIIFSSVRSGKWDLWSIKPDGAELKRITDTPEDEHSPTLSPDGEKIAYVYNREIWVIRADGKGKEKLPLPVGIYAQPTWTNDGLGIAFVQYTVLPSDEGVIWLIKRREDNTWGVPVRVSSHPPSRLYPAFSPDGTHMAYAECRRDRLLGVIEEIGVLAVADKTFTTITDDEADSFEPEWSPAGDHIAYTSDISGSYDIWVINVKSGKKRRLTTDPAYDGDPTWSVDGSKIAFVSSRSGNKEIWIISATGHNPKQVTKMGTNCKDIVWVRDNHHQKEHGNVVR